MEQEPALGLMLQDALEHTLANPTAVHRWHTLLALYLTDANANQRAVVCHRLLAGVAQEGEVGFFCACFLASVTGEMQYSAQAGRLVQTIAPWDADRLMAFAVYEWGRHVATGSGHQQLVQSLRSAHIPELMQSLGQALLQSAPLPPRTSTRLQKIAIIAPYIGNDAHPPTLMAFQQARLLQGLGLQVHVFSSQELRVQHMADYLANQGQFFAPAPSVEQLQQIIPPGVGLTLSDDRFSLMRRWKDTLQAVATFDPDLVLLVGLNSPLMTPLHAARPTVGLCVHAIAPMAPVDVWLAAKPEEALGYSHIWEPAMPPAWGHHHPYRIQLKPVTTPVTRTQLGLPETGVILVSAGARLPAEIHGEWAARMCALLDRNPGWTWLLVGGDAALPAALQGVPVAQLRTLPHQQDLRSVLQCADIYVNPQRTGGGFSVAEAMADGLAVLALADSDGGDKLGDAACTDLDNYFAQLQELADDPAARTALGRSLRARFAQWLDVNQSKASLLAACQLAMARHGQIHASGLAARPAQ